ncbi:hypothetical protein SUGI_0112870 [Cryptomeria japonica]|nr:hypothetical protein SUGI_0112870 [Cryptomeria japonica]
MWNMNTRKIMAMCNCAIAKPGARAAEHGVRAPLPRDDNLKQEIHRENEKDILEEARESTAAEREQTDLEADRSPAARHHTAEEVGGGKAGQFLHHTEIPVGNPNYQQSRRWSHREQLSCGVPFDVEKVKGTEEVTDSRGYEGDDVLSTVPAASGEMDTMYERAEESLEQVRSGVPSEQAVGVMTNYVTTIAYFEDPDSFEKFSEEQMESAEETLERGERILREAVECGGDGSITPASRMLRQRLEGRGGSLPLCRHH